MKRDVLNLFIISLLVFVFSCASPEGKPVLSGEPLPFDPAVVTGELDNGVTWYTMQHGTPPGKMALMVHVDTGSLNETEEQRGLAHFMEHMVFNGSENFAPGELIPYFESIGLEFGADANAFTSFDQTAYMLFTPDTETAQIDKALLVLSDYVFRALLLESEIDRERGVILEEIRARQSTAQRVSEKLWDELFEGSRFVNRIPKGLEDVIKSAPRSEFVEYYRTWYRPERINVILVGDAPAERCVPLIEKHFGEYESTTAAAEERGPEFPVFSERRSIIVTDPELAACDVEMIALRSARPPTTTVEQLRVELVDELGGWIMNRRFEERVKKGEAGYQSAGVDVSNFFKETLMVSASATGEPADWEKMLNEVIVEIGRARDHGFGKREFDLAKTDFKASIERWADTESTRRARYFLGKIRRSIVDEEPILSAAQTLELVERLLPTIGLDEVAAAFVKNFEPGAFAYVLTAPDKDGIALPEEDDVLAAARAALARKTEPLKEEEEAKELLAKMPLPGKVVETAADEGLGISSAWFENGVRAHHRFMDYKKDTVYLSISLAGGKIEETFGNAGVTDVAALAFSQPATSRLDSTEITDLMTGKNISVRAMPKGDNLMISITGSPRDLEAGLQLAHALLTDGRIEETAFSVWKTEIRQQLEYMEKMPEFQAMINMIKIAGNNDLRIMPMTVDRLDKQTLSAGQKWLERLCREAPIEVAVVGEIALDEAMPLVARYVGSLPGRERRAPHIDRLRRLDRVKGPWKERVGVETITPKGMAIYGFVGCGRLDVRERRAQELVSQTLTSRLIKRIREEAQLVYSINADNRVMESYNDSSLFYTGAPCDPEKVDDVVKEAEAIFAAFADSGPTPEELENAKKQIVNNLDTTMKEPRFWWGLLQHLDTRRLSLDDYRKVKEDYQSYTAEELCDVFRKYYKPERTFSVVAEPK